MDHGYRGNGDRQYYLHSAGFYRGRVPGPATVVRRGGAQLLRSVDQRTPIRLQRGMYWR